MNHDVTQYIIYLPFLQKRSFSQSASKQHVLYFIMDTRHDHLRIHLSGLETPKQSWSSDEPSAPIASWHQTCLIPTLNVAHGLQWKVTSWNLSWSPFRISLLASNTTNLPFSFDFTSLPFQIHNIFDELSLWTAEILVHGPCTIHMTRTSILCSWHLLDSTSFGDNSILTRIWNFWSNLITRLESLLPHHRWRQLLKSPPNHWTTQSLSHRWSLSHQVIVQTHVKSPSFGEVRLTKSPKSRTIHCQHLSWQLCQIRRIEISPSLPYEMECCSRLATPCGGISSHTRMPRQILLA